MTSLQPTSNPLPPTPSASSLQPPASKSRSRLKILGITIGAVTFLGLGTIGFFTYQYLQATTTPAQSSGPEVKLAIAAGSTTEQIADQLIQANLLDSQFYFKLYLRLHPAKAAIQAGDFNIPQNISIVDLVDKLAVASRQQVVLTFPEGLRREELAEIIQKQYDQGRIAFTGQQFSDLALNPNAKLRSLLGNRLPADASLQGYLFPDTYHIDADATAEELITKMLTNYVKKVTSDIQGGMTKQNLNEYQALTLAAIVERESFSGDERPIIGYIMLERLRIGEILGVDATLQYALGYSKTEQRWWRHTITAQDLELNSPYNTRRRTGLPPAPIANPGLEAIKAVAMPQKTNYLYYLHDAQGRIHYAETLDQHNANVARYL